MVLCQGSSRNPVQGGSHSVSLGNQRLALSILDGIDLQGSLQTPPAAGPGCYLSRHIQKIQGWNCRKLTRQIFEARTWKHSADDHWEGSSALWRMGPLGEKESFFTLHRIGRWVSQKPELWRKTLKTEWVINHVPPCLRSRNHKRRSWAPPPFHSSVWNVGSNRGFRFLKAIRQHKLMNYTRKTEVENDLLPSSELELATKRKY